MEISENIRYVGVNDHEIDLFEGQYKVPNGMAYNSYLILDEKIAVLDTVEKRFKDEWLANIEKELGGRIPDYLVVHHMEPDHSSNIMEFLKVYPNVQVVSNAKAFAMMKQFFHKDIENKVVVSDGGNLCLGNHTLTFVFAPMVHWPEVMVSYESSEKVLFSADAFGKFGANDVEEGWDDEARRYFIGIVGKYGVQVQNLLKKASALDIKTICSLHGPVLKENLGHYISLYDTWSAYRPESEGVVVFFTSVYGDTKEAVGILAKKLEEKGESNVKVYDLARSDMSLCLAEAFRYGKIVLATTTYNASIYPFMHQFITILVEHGFSNKEVGLIENGTWVPMAAKIMKEKLAACKNLTILEPAVKILSNADEAAIAQIDELASKLVGHEEKAEDLVKTKTGWVCKICGYTYEGEELPEGFTCPLCKHPASDFEKVEL